MSQNKLTKEELFKDFEQWVNDFQTHHPQWAPSTVDTYIRDAHRILLTDDCLPGGGYLQVWKYITELEPQAKSQFGSCVKSRFCDKKSDCPSK